MKYSFFKICIILNTYLPAFHYFVYNKILKYMYCSKISEFKITLLLENSIVYTECQHSQHNAVGLLEDRQKKKKKKKSGSAIKFL